ncbi:MAG TPA: LptF/LptG family permease [Rhabdochlamydiaceae bacterium]|nr:LptF/LptG family permease [Rhabdochlamydiaceae bacterium]
MINLKIWQRYFLREFFKIFFLFLFCFYFLYIAIDYCLHIQDFVQHAELQFSKICAYYLFQFVKRADLLIPLALLISTIKVLCSFNNCLELLAFQIGGIELKKFLRPLLVVAFISSLLNLTLEEFVLPHSLNAIDRFYDAHLRHSYSKRKEPLHILHLNDHSKLVYQYYDAAKQAFFDVIWIKNSNDIWRMKYLSADPQNPLGQYVDHLERNNDGFFEKKESSKEYFLKDLKWQRDLPRKGFVPFENRSLLELSKQLFGSQHLSRYETAEIQTQLFFKIAMPFLCLLVVIAVCPSCIKYSRNNSPFFLYSIALFSFISFYAFMDAAVILGENRTFSPLWTIFSPFFAAFSFFGYRFVRI